MLQLLEMVLLGRGGERSRIPAADTSCADPVGGIHGHSPTGGAKAGVRDVPELPSFKRMAAGVMVGRRLGKCGLRVDSANVSAGSSLLHLLLQAAYRTHKRT